MNLGTNPGNHDTDLSNGPDDTENWDEDELEQAREALWAEHLAEIQARKAAK